MMIEIQRISKARAAYDCTMRAERAVVERDWDTMAFESLMILLVVVVGDVLGERQCRRCSVDRGMMARPISCRTVPMKCSM